MAQKNMFWYYRGMGMDSLGKMGKPEEKQIERPGKDEVLARVDALAICASDIKMINMGREYPLFRNRNFENFPAILGHELSLTVVEAGKNLEQRWKPGMRIGIQPDVYMDSIRYCVGVNTDGGMQQYILLKKPTFYSDQGETIFPVKKELSYAAVAQLEPNACVEAAYRRTSPGSCTSGRSRQSGSAAFRLSCYVFYRLEAGSLISLLPAFGIGRYDGHVQSRNQQNGGLLYRRTKNE